MSIRYAIGGNARFLSHQDTLRVFTRALARAGIETVYSQGFNPHPRISLPLPRSVGVESDDELLCVRVKVDESAVCETTEQIMGKLSAALPEGFELFSASLNPTNAAPQVRSVDYIFCLSSEADAAGIKAGIERVLASESLKIARQTDDEGSTKTVDVRPFIESLEFENGCVTAGCRITGEGTIRPEEILLLLELDKKQLSAPISRCHIKIE